MKINKILIEIQSELKVPKNQWNNFGGYNYRNCEDILETIKPLLKQHNAYLIISDKPIQVGEWIFIEATATLTHEDQSLSVTASARHAEKRKGMDDSQVSGATSSYARKYALNGLFCIDDEKDADTTNTGNPAKKAVPPVTNIPKPGAAPASSQLKAVPPLLGDKSVIPHFLPK